MGSIFLLSPLLIYFPRLIPGIETQPWLALGMSMWALGMQRSGSGARAAVGIVLTTLLLGIAVSIVSHVSFSAGLSTLQFAVGPVLLCGVMTWKPLPPSRHSVAIVALLLLGLAALERLLPGAYSAFSSLLLDRASVSDGHRGVSLLTPEPTYASISLVYTLLLALWSRRCWGKEHPWVEYLLVVLLLMTFSTYAMLMLAILFFLYRPALALSLAAAGLILAGGLIANATEEGSIRAVVALSRLMAVDPSAILASISVLDPSLGYRVISISVGVATALSRLTGFGLGCDSVGQAFSALGWDFVLDDQLLGPAVEHGCLKPSSFLASAFVAYGMLALLLVVLSLVTLAVTRRRRRGVVFQWWPPFCVAALILMVQGQVTSPVPWFLIYISLFSIQSVKVARTSPPRVSDEEGRGVGTASWVAAR